MCSIDSAGRAGGGRDEMEKEGRGGNAAQGRGVHVATCISRQYCTH